MISFRWFSELRKLSIAPVIITTVYNYTTNAGAMTTDPFGSRLYYYVRAMLKRTENITTGTECIINDQWQVICFSEISEFFKVWYIQARIADCFKVNSFCILVNVFDKAFYIITISKACFNA